MYSPEKIASILKKYPRSKQSKKKLSALLRNNSLLLLNQSKQRTLSDEYLSKHFG
tara:strand:- start:1492 stop:1656 length:165 start_codon:yes stop_codon:yes gene_type:complete